MIRTTKLDFGAPGEISTWHCVMIHLRVHPFPAVIL